ncbi:MAG TPA: type 4a pilus biogenesis protein PilO [Candidatus Omnitrophota bacterium]|nr:type 4a pilus biogenesis protein PilO [Candidatus Omnitrophota bacterium]HPD83993.1 type 4a pilus biogenesis protein PilO [Candidatus Omnitrophota bacterium]HRZ02850.1 type 4a pilus biogenesis protein PilO [Candidatus Omnitrophota bacterium]
MNITEQLSTRLAALSEKNRYAVLGGIMLAIFIFWYFLLMQPQLKNLMKLSPQITELSRNLAETKRNMHLINEHRARLAQLRDQLKTSGGKILPKEEIPAILEDISRIANESKVRINQIIPIKESQQLVLSKDDGKYYSLPILVTARANYHNIGRFFNRIEGADIFMSITDFDIVANSDDPLLHSLKVTVKAFVREKAADKETKGKK